MPMRQRSEHESLLFLLPKSERGESFWKKNKPKEDDIVNENKRYGKLSKGTTLIEGEWPNEEPIRSIERLKMPTVLLP